MILYITLFVGLCALSLFETFPIWKVNRLALTVFPRRYILGFVFFPLGKWNGLECLLLSIRVIRK